MTNTAFLMILTELIKKNKITLDSPMIIQDDFDIRPVSIVQIDGDGDRVLTANYCLMEENVDVNNEFLSVGEIMAHIPKTNNQIFINGVSTIKPETKIYEWDSYLMDDVYIKNNVLLIEHV